MGNSKILIIIVVAIVVIKLVAVHFYLKTKIDKETIDNEKDEKK